MLYGKELEERFNRLVKRYFVAARPPLRDSSAQAQKAPTSFD